MTIDKKKPDYLTPKEVADVFRCSPKTIRRWVEFGVHFEHREIMKYDSGRFVISRREVERVEKKLKERDFDDIEGKVAGR